MWRRAGATALVLSVSASLLLLGAGAASAAPELSLLPASGPAGTEITVFGTGFAPGDVEIRWGGPSGPLLTTATGPDFEETVVAPDDTPDSYPVIAVVRDGNAVSTSSASFQVTPAPTSTTVQTTVPAAPPTTTAPPSTPAPAPAPDAASEPSRSGGVSGGIDPAMTETVAPEPPASPRQAVPPGQAGAGAGGAATTTTAAPAATTTVVAALAGVAPADPASGAVATTPPAQSAGGSNSAAGDVDSGRALGPTSSSQSAGAVQSPALLVGGLSLSLAAGVIMLVRNRHRLRS